MPIIGLLRKFLILSHSMLGAWTTETVSRNFPNVPGSRGGEGEQGRNHPQLRTTQPNNEAQAKVYMKSIHYTANENLSLLMIMEIKSLY